MVSKPHKIYEFLDSILPIQHFGYLKEFLHIYNYSICVGDKITFIQGLVKFFKSSIHPSSKKKKSKKKIETYNDIRILKWVKETNSIL